MLLIDPFLDLIGNSTGDFNLSEYALSSNLVISNKADLYVDKDKIRIGMIQMTNKFYEEMGIDYPATPQAPLANAVTGFLMVKSFLDNMVISATFLLLMLSILLIYSLMIGDVEEKTYEYGMLRALGFK